MAQKDLKNTAKETKKPWPTKAAMEQVYSLGLWGDNGSKFYSGTGSHNQKVVMPYLKGITAFLASFKKPLRVCDLGCGDFNIGKELVRYTKSYIAIDIVPALIAHNKATFKDENLEFHCLDIATADLPKADCVILRQVLQHLSNTEIKQVVSKLSDFQYIILTEHLPDGNFEPNLDIISGQGIRLKKQSGVRLLALPFNLKVKEEKVVSSTSLGDDKGIIVTTIYTRY